LRLLRDCFTFAWFLLRSIKVTELPTQCFINFNQVHVTSCLLLLMVTAVKPAASIFAACAGLFMMCMSCMS
jgi:hypothetical protein